MPTNDSWRVDETYIKIKGHWCYLYRAVDSDGATIDFWISENQDKKSAEKFFKKALKANLYLNNIVEQDYRNIKGI
jgi:IS6 family transposase